MTNSALTVAVALCTHNGAKYLRGQLESILAQGRRPDEIVVSDDASTDDTELIVREALGDAAALGISAKYLGGGPRLGVTANFERAIAACGTDVVVLCDQDDVWHPSRISGAVDAFERSGALLFRHENARLVDERGTPLGLSLFEALGVTRSDRDRINRGDAFAAYLRRNLATGATVSFRRSLFDRAAPLPGEWVHDEWLAMIAAATGRVEVSADISVDYRQHGSNVIGVAAPTLRYKFRRMLATAPDRNAILAARARVLADRLAGMDGIATGMLAAAEAKARFEAERAGLPRPRFRRIAGILRANRVGRYRRFASQGALDMLRDFVKG